MSLQQAYQRTLILTLFIKLALAFFLPMSGDEAYFIVWARHLDFGYYDHPPMVGWVLYLMRFVGDGELVMRLPAVLFSTLIGVGIYRLIKPHDASRAALAAMLFLISPVNVLGVLMTTDTPLILFVFLSVYALVRALQNNQPIWYLLSGVALGLAFLSKYFAVLLGLAYLAFFLFTPQRRQRWQGFSILVLAALPFVALNVYWNYTHCWDNILFNLYNRNEGASWSYKGVLTYVGTTLYLMTPPVVYYWWQQRAVVVKPFEPAAYKLYVLAFWVPMAIFLILSFKKTIGLHWVLAFYPFFYLFLAQKLSELQLLKALKFMAWFTAAHLLVIVGVLAVPTAMWQHSKVYSSYIFLMHGDEVAAGLRPYERDFIMATTGYSDAAIMSYHYGKEFPVYGEGSRYARQDDMNTDYRQMEGKNILTIDKKSPPDLKRYAPYFARVEVRELKVRDAVLYLTLGYGFNYSAYRQGVLTKIRDQYYRVPEYLPHSPCYFCEKYFAGEDC